MKQRQFIRGQRGKEFASVARSRPPSPSSAPYLPAPEHTATGRQVSNFYACLVETSGQPWAQDSECKHNETSNPSSEPDTNAANTATARTAATTAAATFTVDLIPASEEEKSLLQPSTRDHFHDNKKPKGSVVLPPDSIGYQLLKRAGWKEGAGIGKEEKGNIEPLNPEIRPKNVGIGYEKKSHKKRKAVESGDVEARDVEERQKVKSGRQSDGGRAPSRPFPPDELASEDVETKMKRTKQVLQVEVDEKAGKALAKLVYGAFKDDGGPGGSSGTRDSNPLLRKNTKLSARNPLL